MTTCSRTLILFASLAALSSGVALILIHSKHEPSTPVVAPNSTNRISAELAAEVAAIEAREQTLRQTAWAREVLAQEYGRTFESFWDSINATTNKLKLSASFAVGEIQLGLWNAPQSLPHGIEIRESTGSGPTLSAEEWRRFVEKHEATGWQLLQTEFRHRRFETDEAGQPRQSHFYFSAHLIKSPPHEPGVGTRSTTSVKLPESQMSDAVERVPTHFVQGLNTRNLTGQSHSEHCFLEGDLVVGWAPKRTSNEVAPVKRIDATHLKVKTRHGELPFRTILSEQIPPPVNAYSIDPLILYDLDGDGSSEIILAAKNLVYRRRSPDRYVSEPLCRFPPGLISTAIIGDFDSDGAPDFLCQQLEGLRLYKGSPQGVFAQPGELVWAAPRDLKYPMVLTCGDVDRDGDLDVFVAQYKVPYENGSMPTPYYDANDGHPAYLLLNDSQGKFSDATIAAGLVQKRWRRSYSASLVDQDGDGHLDLVVVSDFAGVDLYQNDGHGHFTDVTSKWVSEPHAFGMAHALADFNADGRLDLLMIGMTSPTADRLEHSNLWRPDATGDRTMRARMTFGNRLYLARLNGGFEQNALSDSIARSGWSWGCSAFDFDNDGFTDVYLANGLESRQSVRDYESEYWLHDAFVGNSTEESAAYLYFKNKFARTRGAGESYGGYEKNRLYLNRRSDAFVEIGHLLGMAFEQDSRNVVSDDLDGDGRVDLLVTSFEAWPEAKQTLRVCQNILDDPGNWIGFRFREEGKGKSPVGVRVMLRYDGRSVVRQIVNGDSYRSQHANTVHFGLGHSNRVESVEIRWANGQAITLREPAINQYHFIHAPAESRVQP